MVYKPGSGIKSVQMENGEKKVLFNLQSGN